MKVEVNIIAVMSLAERHDSSRVARRLREEDWAESLGRTHRTPSSSTSKTSVAFGGMTGGKPRAP